MLKSGHVWKKDEHENKGGGLKIRKVHLFERKKILLKITKKKNNRGAKLMISNEDWKLFNNPFQD